MRAGAVRCGAVGQWGAARRGRRCGYLRSRSASFPTHARMHSPQPPPCPTPPSHPPSHTPSHLRWYSSSSSTSPRYSIRNWPATRSRLANRPKPLAPARFCSQFGRHGRGEGARWACRVGNHSPPRRPQCPGRFTHPGSVQQQAPGRPAPCPPSLAPPPHRHRRPCSPSQRSPHPAASTLCR